MVVSVNFIKELQKKRFNKIHVVNSRYPHNSMKNKKEGAIFKSRVEEIEETDPKTGEIKNI